MASQIQQFYADQTIFITGGTGFLGKVLIEKLLRSTSCKMIFVLIRAKKTKSAHDRFKQLFDDLFDRLKSECADYAKRITCLNGDCMLDNLGLQPEDVMILQQNINIVFHLAATVRFTENLRHAYAINVRAVGDVIKLCRTMRQLKSIIYVSTAYSHCYRDKIDECFYDVPMDHQKLSNLLEQLNDAQINENQQQIMNKWPNYYALTKAIAEDLIRQETKIQLPIAIYRPAIITSTCQQPLPGWTDNVYGATGLAAAILMGILRWSYMDGQTFAELVPVDYCADALIAIAWDLTTQKSTQLAPIYNYVSSIDNPIVWENCLYLSNLNALNYPSMKSLWIPNSKITNNRLLVHIYRFMSHLMPAIFIDLLLFCSGKRTKMLRTYKILHTYNDLSRLLTINDPQFSNRNIKELLEKMNDKDRELYQFDLKTVQWLSYFQWLVKGLRIYQFNDPLETLDDARRRLWWLKKIDLILSFSMKIFVLFIIYLVFVTIFC